MKNLLTYIVAVSALCCLPLTAEAAEPADTLTARYVFQQLESPVFDLLSHSTRFDMLAYNDVGRSYEARNELGGVSTLDTLTTRFARITLSGVSGVEIMTVPYSNSGLALLSYTVDTDGADSELLVVDASLKTLPASRYFKAPVLADFMTGQDRARLKKNGIESLAGFFTAQYAFDPENLTMTVTPTVKGIMSEEAYERLRPYISNPDGTLRTLTYAWTGKRLQKQK